MVKKGCVQWISDFVARTLLDTQIIPGYITIEEVTFKLVYHISSKCSWFKNAFIGHSCHFRNCKSNLYIVQAIY